MGSLVLGGYFLGSFVPNISERIHWVILAVVALSFLPVIVGAVRARYARKVKTGGLPAGQSSED